jgi:uncharacterized protein (TIGR03118 family)
MKAPVKLCTLFVSACVTLLAPTFTFAQHYIQTNLVSDGGVQGANPAQIDANLKNPWGLTRSGGSPWWVSDNNAGVSTLYNGAGVAQALIVKIPGPVGSPSDFVSAPTGVVNNGSPTDFLFVPAAGGAQTSAHFIFCTEDGTIAAWASGTVATLVVDNSKKPTAREGAVYKGCTSGDVGGQHFFYLANFRSGHVEVYDTNFNRARFSEERFDDDQIPPGFAPFNVQNIGGSIFVTYAKQDAAKHDDVAGEGLGFVDIYSPAGKLEARLQHGPWLNAPWGVVWAPRDFGEFSNRVLVGNFGSGWIAAYNGFDGKFIGFMKNPDDSRTFIDGLWSLTFGNSASAGPYNSLFFTAGPNDEQDGLFGTLTPVPAELADGDEE